MATSTKSQFTLNDGVKVPVIAYGTYFDSIASSATIADIKEADYLRVKQYLKSALIDNGFIHIDTAEMYKSEIVIGRALKELNIDRKKLFITSKIWAKLDDARCDRTKPLDREQTLLTVRNSSKYLQTDYIDLFLIHSPHSMTGDGSDIIEVYKTLLELKQKGIIRSVGVSNFGVSHLKTLIEVHKLPPPSVNQLHLHPFSRDLELLGYCEKYNILIEAYSPLFKGQSFKFRGFDKEIRCFDHPVLRYIAEKYNKNSAQIMLKWCVQSGYVPIFKTTKAERMKKYANIFDFELNTDEMTIIDLLNQGYSGHISWQPMLSEKWDYKIKSKL